MAFSDVLNNIEDHITISTSSTVAYTLVSKDSLPVGYEELQPLDDATNTTNSSVLSRELSTNSIAYSSDSDIGKIFLLHYCR